jgi:hypothetical protein
MQAPSVRRYPDLTTKPYWELSDFPKECADILRLFDERSQILLDEYESGITAIKENSTPGVTKYFGATKGWRHYPIVRQSGKMVKEAAHIFPEYYKILSSLCDLNYLQRVFFATMDPGIHLESHCGGANSSLRMHFAIKIPDGDTALRVGGTNTYWEEGASLFFDDSFVHSAWNNCKSPKVVLLMRILHPDWSAEERAALLEIEPKFWQSVTGQQLKLFLEQAPEKNQYKKLA